MKKAKVPRHLLVVVTICFAVALGLTSSALRESCSPPSASNHAHNLVVVIPFVARDISSIMDNMRSWSDLCDSNSDLRVSLRFLYSRSLEEFRSQHVLLLEERMMLDDKIVSEVMPCFSHDVRTIFANLSDVEDVYPNGPSHMFYKLMLSLAHLHLSEFTHMFWMEWDVRPVRDNWLTILYTETYQSVYFWMRGCGYSGREYDKDVHLPSARVWINHINGNALYRLHDPQFNNFVALTMEREPPGGYWKPFDTALWMTMHDLDYSFHIYQQHRSRLQITDVIFNAGVVVRAGDIEAALSNNPRIHLVHGNENSAGPREHKIKYPRGRPLRSANKELWMGEMPESLKVSVFMVTDRAEWYIAEQAMLAMLKNFPRAVEYVIVVPEEELEYIDTSSLLLNRVVVVGGNVKVAEINAVHHCHGAFILHVRATDILFRPLLLRDFIMVGKPVISVSRLANDKADSATSTALGRAVEYNFTQTDLVLYPRAVYGAAKRRLEDIHRLTIDDYFSGTVDAVSLLGAYLYYEEPQSAVWIHTKMEEVVPLSLPLSFPRMTCTAKSGLKNRDLRNQQRDMAVKIVQGGGETNCQIL